MTNAGDTGVTAVSTSPGSSPAHTHDQAPIPSAPADIQAAIEERQRRLASTVDELTHRVSPKELARRGAASAQTKARRLAASAETEGRRAAASAQTGARQALTADDGSPRTDRIAAVAASALVILGALVWRRTRR
jgi:hypothetical protein